FRHSLSNHVDQYRRNRSRCGSRYQYGGHVAADTAWGEIELLTFSAGPPVVRGPASSLPSGCASAAAGSLRPHREDFVVVVVFAADAAREGNQIAGRGPRREVVHPGRQRLDRTVCQRHHADSVLRLAVLFAPDAV